MRMLFCCDPLLPRVVDLAYREEMSAAEVAGLPCVLLDYEALVLERDAAAAVRRIPEGEGDELMVYQGWMLRPEAYERCYDALRVRGYLLINAPYAYRHCHYLPESYAAIAAQTPQTVWLPLAAPAADVLDMGVIMRLLERFGAHPVLLKDFVKSRKHEWDEACYIASAADWAAVERVVRRFIELQGDDLSEGLVFREFVPLRGLATPSQSGMPLSYEYRAFFLDDALLHVAPYWDEGDYDGAAPPLEEFAQTVRQVWSRFFTMDVAQRQDGTWTIIELGDAQVAGLPERTSVSDFYVRLAERLAP